MPLIWLFWQIDILLKKFLQSPFFEKKKQPAAVKSAAGKKHLQKNFYHNLYRILNIQKAPAETGFLQGLALF
jgi:hypothetical protein